MGSPVRRRSCLSVPAGSEKMLAKAPNLAADEIVLDLEDGVAARAKDAARAHVVAALAGSAFASRTVAVRVNAIGTPWCHEDIIAVAAVQRPGLTLVLPKLESADDLAFVDRLLLGVEARHGTSRIGLQGLIETAVGLANVAAIAGASSRLESLILGYGDLASSLGRSPDAGWGFAQDAVLVAARSNGLAAIDGPHFAYGADAQAGLEAACRQAMRAGFDGKWAIHPSQVAVIDAAFTPSDVEVVRARGVVAALDAVQADGTGVTSHEGGMIDEAMREGAERILARAAR